MVEPFLIEYTGMEPHLYKSGVNDEKNYRWMMLGMSNTDFVVRDPMALTMYAVTGVSDIAATAATREAAQ